jgi:hypothetical protein
MSYSKAWNNIPQTPSPAQMLDETDTETSNISAQERVWKIQFQTSESFSF